MGKDTHKKKDPLSQPLLCARIDLGFWVFSAFTACLFLLGLWFGFVLLPSY